jgi:hypothetical protein
MPATLWPLSYVRFYLTSILAFPTSADQKRWHRLKPRIRKDVCSRGDRFTDDIFVRYPDVSVDAARQRALGNKGGVRIVDAVKPYSPACHFITLRDALERASLALPGFQRTPAVKACLADNILALAASGEIDPARLGQSALARVRESCTRCGGCEGLTAIPEQPPSGSNQIPWRSLAGKRRGPELNSCPPPKNSKP